MREAVEAHVWFTCGSCAEEGQGGDWGAGLLDECTRHRCGDWDARALALLAPPPSPRPRPSHSPRRPVERFTAQGTWEEAQSSRTNHSGIFQRGQLGAAG